ncbi:MAG: tRNA epoxyqueuosine(34) reductase QueG [Anaerolineae bacterium]
MARRLKAKARALGFGLVGVTSPVPSPRGAAAYLSWLADGLAGEMVWMGRPDRVRRTRDPRRSLPAARSLIVVGCGYYSGAIPPDLRADPSRGIIASYAWGRDYHDVMLPRLHALAAWIDDQCGRPVASRAYVDTGPLLERDAAARASLGFTGRNTMHIHPEWGAWLFLGGLLVDLDLPADARGTTGTCGQCTRCLEACPTAAFRGPYVLDARRCISYLTIELKGPIPPELRPALGNRIFGCDVCNEVCPYNLAAERRRPEPTPDLEIAAPHLLDLISMDDSAFRHRFGHTPVQRAKRRGLGRNVAVALGNWGDPRAVGPLAQALRDEEALIRGHAAWALGVIGNAAARSALEGVRDREPDAWVQAEVSSALAGASEPRKMPRTNASSSSADVGKRAGREEAKDE